MDVIFQNALIITDGLEMTADIAVRDGVIKAIGELDGLKSKLVIPCSGKILLPGAVDLALNLFDGGAFDPKSMSGFGNATRDAALGGVTTVISAVELDEKYPVAPTLKALAEMDAKRAFVDFGYHVLVSDENSKQLTQAREIVAAGVPSFWIARALSAQGAPLSEVALPGLPEDSLALVSCWNAAIAEAAARNNAGEPDPQNAASLDALEALFISALGEKADVGSCKILVNGISSAAAVQALARAREASPRITGACHIGHLVTAEGTVDSPRLWPPLPSKSDQQTLYAAIEEGIISAISAGHKPRTGAEVAAARSQNTIVAGMPALAHFLPALNSEGIAKWRLSFAALSLAACADPAKLAGLYPRKGSLQIGSDADIVIFDPALPCNVVEVESYTSKGFVNPFVSGMLTGRVTDVYVRGGQVVANGDIIGGARGNFLSRKLSLR